jgi:ribonucleoside-diphosphate reductase alpha chain
MGLGITGLANALEAMGLPYGSVEFVIKQEEILRTLAVECYRASALLSKEKGPFPAFDTKDYLRSAFLQRSEFDEVRELISQFGIRNSHLTSIAPTGTISVCADNVSSGIEPVFAYAMDRAYIGPNGPETVSIPDYGVARLGVRGKRTKDVTRDEHLSVLKCAARWTDSAVSKTCNLTGAMPWDDFKDIYMQAWEGGVKGVTVFNIDGKRNAVLTSTDDDGDSACQIDLESGKRECE